MTRVVEMVNQQTIQNVAQNSGTTANSNMKSSLHDSIFTGANGSTGNAVKELVQEVQREKMKVHVDIVGQLEVAIFMHVPYTYLCCGFPSENQFGQFASTHVAQLQGNGLVRHGA